MKKTLRPYQQEALNQLRVRLKETTDPLLVNASVGAGKSLIIAELLKIIEKANWRALCLTMNSTLIQQNAETYQEQGGHPGIYCSGLGQKDITAPVIFGSPHSIAKGIKANKKIKEVPFNLIVIDECFPAGTLIDNRNIESLLPGEFVNSYNHKKNLIEKKKILNVQKRSAPEKFYCIRTHYAVTITTENHPFYVQGKGYVCAKELNPGDVLYDNRSSLHYMRGNNKKCFKISKMEIKKNRGYLSYKWLRMEFKNKKRKFFRKNEKKQSYASPGIQKQNDLFFKRNWSQTTHPGRKWARINRTTKKITGIFGHRMDSRMHYKNTFFTQRWISTSLQSGLRSQIKKNCYRNRRTFSCNQETKRKRCKKNEFIKFIRVESIEIHKRTNIEKLYPHMQFDYVYNLEVEDNNNYFANNVLVHNCHNINPDDNASMYMRILNHYGLQAQTEQYNFRIVGLTGTPYRGKSVSIVGKEALFKEQVCSISTSWLIANDFLVPPIFGKPRVESFDMKDIRTDSLGKFRNKDLEEAIHRNERLTGQIIREVVSVVEGGRNGAFIFASTIPHAEECMRSLPPETSAIITGDTPHEKRKTILSAAKHGHIKYLVNVATLLVGVDVPNFDVCAWLRPTESLTLYVQGIGRVLRLSSGKQDALVLDYAGNLERHGDLDDPIIVDAIKQQEEEKEYCIPCFDCGTMNTMHARRCIGYRDKHGNVLPRGEGVKAVTKKGYSRCEHFFEFKTCDACETINDKVARHCRSCGCELIDPNTKLSEIGANHTLDVINAQYWTKKNVSSGTPSVFVRYLTKQGEVFESYYVSSEKAKYVFYGKFVKHHVRNSSDFFPYLTDPDKVDEMIYETELKTPNQIICNIDKNQRYKVMRKVFYGSDI